MCDTRVTSVLQSPLRVCGWDTSRSAVQCFVKATFATVVSVYIFHLLVFVVEADCVLCEVRPESLFIALSTSVITVD